MLFRSAPELRPSRCLCTFHQNQKIVKPDLSSLPERAQAYRELAANASCVFTDHRLAQKECWELHGQFAFQVSPHGNGLDCFRTWESLYLGTIPIVKSSSLDPLYEDHRLPVVIVKSWAEITPQNLHAWRERFQPLLGDMGLKLSLDYWVAQIKRASRQVEARA